MAGGICAVGGGCALVWLLGLVESCNRNRNRTGGRGLAPGSRLNCGAPSRPASHTPIELGRSGPVLPDSHSGAPRRGPIRRSMQYAL